MVGESGLFTPDDIAYVQDAGVRAVSIVNFTSTSSNPCQHIHIDI